ncbi:hypothetical protein Patl1_23846 [Pistacia atlantica]|uniref:Uncharacterized protein n=1 Tax=Pistacia atlantica TaxID=434234 RepID=A0ACC0ZYG2_9ROSI|nr:hypothetical protein Patl1_23846 [Pistacia atlantica]
MHIVEREKLSYIRGKKPPPKESDEGYKKWYAENQKVKRWLLMSMSPEIMKRYLCLSTTREIWSALSKAFYDGSDGYFSSYTRKPLMLNKMEGHSQSIVEN